MERSSKRDLSRMDVYNKLEKRIEKQGGESMENQELWDDIVSQMKNKLGPNAYNTWFKHSNLITVEEKKLVVQASNEFAADWIRKHYLHEIEKAAEKVFKRSMSITITNKNAKAYQQ